MIVVDTSALIAILMEEPKGEECLAALIAADEIAMSAGTLTEASIVSGARGCRPALERLIHELAIEIVPLTPDLARKTADGYEKYGKGSGSAKLNLGDTFAYTLAVERNSPLLFIGLDFSLTDIRSVLPHPAPSLPDRLA